ncbi:carcinoembryonic antigen-related cell adhesion molecule 5 [Pseudorasbora parva]|uniref:carcinoembryonic antigen-related cell adhesion molecule 5 n=1 Tax=Pseudorasbora parva TaxID=51549 RepID=UPI00351DF267
MDFFNFRVTLLILAALGCCSQALLLGDKINGVVGKNVTFKTTISTTVGLSTVLWSFNNGQSIASVFTHVPVTNILRTNPLYTGRVSYNTTTCELQLGPLKKEDAGKYILNIVNAEGDAQSGEIELTVLEPVTDVKISSSLLEAIEFNSTVVLTCTAKGSFSYKWINGSDALTVDGTHMKLNPIGNELTITEVRRTDLRGPIFCRAENALESGMSAPFNLNVSYGPEKIVMTQNPTNSFLKKGSNLTLTCSADSDPPAQLRWMFNGAELHQMANITLSNLEEKNSGNYSCVAYNVKTNRNVASPVALVTVLEALSGTNISSSTSLLIAGNSTVNLTCSAAAGVAESVEWLKDGKPLVSNDHAVLSANKKTLTIVQVEKVDAGEYKCILKNKVNTDQASYKMVINYGPENVQVKAKNAVKFEERIELACSSESVPPSMYRWKLNETVMNFTQAVYVIEKAKITDSGTYTCEAMNPITRNVDKKIHKLAVTEVGAVDEGLSGGAIAGIVIAVLVAVIIIACIIKRKKKSGSDIPSPY